MQPDRCKNSRLRRSTAQLLHTPLTANITETALKQNTDLNEEYRDAKFFGVPIRGKWDFNTYEMYAPNSCKFHTYAPHRLAIVSCQDGITCKLTHQVTTTKSYTSSEGRNWGVKLSPKLSFLEIFEVGGEVAYDSTYTCSFTEGKTTTDTVDCAVGTDNGGKTLQLYNVQSDMECQFSTVRMNPDSRNNSNGQYYEPFLTDEEVSTIRRDAIIDYSGWQILPNLDKMPSQLFEKLRIKFPLWNPYTDLISIYIKVHGVLYFKEVGSDPGPKRVIPFTNEHGDSIFQYACRLQ